MQSLKYRFHEKDKGRYSSLQSCIRTDDLHLVGDGSHLTSFEMLGNFSFGNNDYTQCIYMWDLILKDLNFPVDYITCHPTQSEHISIWQSLGYTIKLDEDCVWSDGVIGGYCCEVFTDDLEVGNLVNPMGDSVDVGFGLERMVQILESKTRSDETSLFNCKKSPIVRDHLRTLDLMTANRIIPGSKGRRAIMKKILRNLIPYKKELFGYVLNMVDREVEFINQKKVKLEEFKDKFHTRDWDYWHQTHGLSREEIEEFLHLSHSSGII